MTPLYEIDNFPFEITADSDPSDHIVHHHGVWGGPQNAETEAARIEGLKRAWVGADERRAQHSKALKERRPTMKASRPHQNGMTLEHRQALSRALKGNQNARKRKPEST